MQVSLGTAQYFELSERSFFPVTSLLLNIPPPTAAPETLLPQKLNGDSAEKKRSDDRNWHSAKIANTIVCEHLKHRRCLF